MKLVALALLSVLVAGGGVAAQEPATPQPAHPSLPWLFNLQDTVAVDAGDPDATLSMEFLADTDPSCDDAAYPGLALKTDLGGPAGRETIVASYSHGVLVYGSEGQLVASTPGYPCEGSADDLEVLGFGHAFGAPTLVLAATTGGRREQLTWLGLYRVGLNGRLEATFAGAIEQREDGIVRRGSVTLLPGALLHRSPDGELTYWIYDSEGGVYVPRGSLNGPEIPHV